MSLHTIFFFFLFTASVSRVRPESLPQEDDDDDDGSEEAVEGQTPPAKNAKRARKPRKERTWNKKTDIT